MPASPRTLARAAIMEYLQAHMPASTAKELLDLIEAEAAQQAAPLDVERLRRAYRANNCDDEALVEWGAEIATEYARLAPAEKKP